ncbi:Zn(2)-C6 fungal-type DNA-binding domain protein [Ilyonectria robusta]
MSIRRKSCDPCFRSRRKCDLTYPVCDRCERNNKRCHYAYPPQLPVRTEERANVARTALMRNTAESSSSGSGVSSGDLGQIRGVPGTFFELSRHSALQLYWEQLSIVYKTPGNLGDLPPVGGLQIWDSILDHMRNYPRDFAQGAENTFIHKALFTDSFPRPLRAAWTICAGCVSINDRNHKMLFQALDAELSELITPSTPVVTSTLLEDLVWLQAVLLYQLIRFFFGGIEQRNTAERQEFIIRSYGLRLLQRANVELANAERTWENWILAESIRRTVFIAFKLYTMYSYLRYRICNQYDALKALPVSTKLGSWESRDAYNQYSDMDETISYGETKLLWLAPPESKTGNFEELLFLDKDTENHIAALDQYELIV